MWEEWKLAAYHAVAVSKATAELMEEDEKEEDKEVNVGEGSFTKDLMPKLKLASQTAMLMVPQFWVVGLSDQVARSGSAANSRAQGKAPTIQAEPMPLTKTDKELVCQFQAEELVAEEAHQGRDAATLEVVIEAAESLVNGQLEGLGVLARQVIAPP